MKYNILYWILTKGTVPSSDQFYKRACSVPLSDRAERLRSMLVPKEVGAERLGLYASTLCAFSLDTQFGAEIAALDRNNTYRYPKRAIGASAGQMTLHDVTCGVDRLSGIVGELDSDIADRLVVPQWIDVMAAGCLQALRGVV